MTLLVITSTMVYVFTDFGGADSDRDSMLGICSTISIVIMILLFAFWINKKTVQDERDGVRFQFHKLLYPRDTSELITEFKNSERLPIRFFMNIGLYDLGVAMLGTNRQLRDVLQVKGYNVDYREFDGAHAYVNWRGSLADGLISLLGEREEMCN